MKRKTRNGKGTSKNRIESRISVPSDIPTEDISAKILTSISKAVEKPFVNELHRWMGPDSDRRSLTSSLSVSIYSDITFFDGESLNEFDLDLDVDLERDQTNGQFV
jgi:hypothetical protein